MAARAVGVPRHWPRHPRGRRDGPRAALGARATPDWEDVRRRTHLGCGSDGVCSEEELTRELRSFVKEVLKESEDKRQVKILLSRNPATMRRTT